MQWAVETWYQDKAAIEQLRRNAMQQRFDWSEAAKGYEDLYRHIIGGRLSSSHQ